MKDRSSVVDVPDLDVSPEEEFSAYLPHIRRRWQARREAGERRRREAWRVARGVAVLLRSQFGATHVIAFGSLVHPGVFSEHSDIDLAVAGIRPADFFRAWPAAGAACPFEMDLVDLRDCSPTLCRLIEEEGVEL